MNGSWSDEEREESGLSRGSSMHRGPEEGEVLGTWQGLKASQLNGA